MVSVGICSPEISWYLKLVVPVIHKYYELYSTITLLETVHYVQYTWYTQSGPLERARLDHWTAQSRHILPYMETEGLLLWSEEPDIGSCTERD
jgi:hypothetical protein